MDSASFFFENYCRNCLKSEKTVNSLQSTYMIFVRGLFSPSALSSGESFVLLIRKCGFFGITKRMFSCHATSLVNSVE